MSLNDDIKRMMKNQVRVDVMTVLELADDPSKVTLDDGTGEPLNDVPCLSSYDDRAAGDHVMVLKLGSSWVVIGATGKVPTEEGPDEAQIKNWIQAAINDADIGPVVTVSRGSAATPSGSGWIQASSLPWYRDDGSGNRSIYFPTGSSDPSPTQKPPPPGTKRDPKLIDPVAARAYRTNGQQSSTLLSGPATPWGSSARWTTAFFYGDALHDALNAAPVDYVEMTLARISGPGWNRKEPLRLGMHGAKNKTKITQLSSSYIATKLAWGGKDTFRLKDSFVNALKNGDQDGLGLTSSVSGEYLGVTSGSGHIRVVYQ